MPIQQYTLCPASMNGPNNDHCFCGINGKCCFCSCSEVDCRQYYFSTNSQPTVYYAQLAPQPNYAPPPPPTNRRVDNYPLTPSCKFMYFGVEYEIPATWSQTKVNTLYKELDKSGLQRIPYELMNEPLIEDDGSEEVKG